MLLQLYVKSATLKLEQFDFEAIMEDLAKNGYQGTLADLRGKIAELFHAPINEALAEKGFLFGDLFFLPDRKLIFLKCEAIREEGENEGEDVFDDPGKHSAITKLKVYAGLVVPIGESDGGELTAFCDSISTILEVKFDAPDIKWQDDGKKKTKRPTIEAKSIKTPTESEIELAGILRDGKLEPLYTALEDNNGQLILDQWLEDREDAEEIEYFIDKLFEADLFEEEIVVYNQDDQPVFRAKDRASLEALQSAGIRDINGNPMDTSNVRRLILFSKGNKDKLSLAWQARIFLTDLLFKTGLSNEDIMVLGVKNNLDQILIYYDDQPILFLLSDAAIEAEAFAECAALCGKLGNPHIVAITKENVDVDAAQAAGASGCTAIGSLDEINSKLVELFSDNRLHLIANTMADFNKMISLNVVSMTLARLESN